MTKSKKIYYKRSFSDNYRNNIRNMEGYLDKMETILAEHIGKRTNGFIVNEMFHWYDTKFNQLRDKAIEDNLSNNPAIKRLNNRYSKLIESLEINNKPNER